MIKSKGSHFSIEKDLDGCVHLSWHTPGKSFADSHATFQHNQMTLDGLFELENLLDVISNGPRPALLMLSSGRKGSFGTGFSLETLKELANRNQLTTVGESFQRCCEKLGQLPCPTIAAISGLCSGEALELAGWCDFRVAFGAQRTRLGFQSVQRNWFPRPMTFSRMCSLMGLERAFKIINSNILLDAQTALRWGLIDSAPMTESELRKSIGLFKGKALAQGKVENPSPKNWMRRFLQANSWGRKWVAKGLGRWMDRSMAFGNPWADYLISSVRWYDTQNKSLQSSLLQYWALASTDKKCLDCWTTTLRFESWQNANAPKDISEIHHVTCDSHPVPNHLLTEKLTERNIQLQTLPKIRNGHTKDHSAGMAPDSPIDLKISGLAPSFSDTSGGLPTSRQPAKWNPVGVTWRPYEKQFNEVILWGPFQAGQMSFASVIGNHSDCTKVASALAFLQIQSTSHESPENSWTPLVFTLLESCLKHLAQEINPAMLEIKARKRGWRVGPCIWMQENGLHHLATTILRWQSHKIARNLDYSLRFSNWLLELERPKLLGTKNFRPFWLNPLKVGQFRTTSLSSHWHKFAGAQTDVTLKALPPPQRHMEALERMENQLAQSLLTLPDECRKEAVLVFFHGLLGFPGWKIRELFSQVPGLSGDLF